MNHVSAAAVALALIAVPASARAQDQEALKRNYEKKLAAEFMKVAPWITDYDKAKEEAKKSGKLILSYFTRSYAN